MFFGPAYASDPVADILAAALGASETARSKPQQKPAACGQGVCGPRRFVISRRLANPNFDVSELENEYIVEGELPGVSDKSSISIEFDDAQTIVIKGEIHRVNRAAPVAQEKQQSSEQQAVTSSPVASESTTTLSGDEQSKESRRHSVTVEDEVDESEAGSDYEVVDGPAPSRTNKGKAKESADVEMTEAKPTQEQPKDTKTAVPAAKLWVSERSVGVFDRRFNFQGLIDQDNVKASLENGLLTVVVPKRKPYVRQVQID